jgi:hypothetical protein
METLNQPIILELILRNLYGTTNTQHNTTHNTQHNTLHNTQHNTTQYTQSAFANTQYSNEKERGPV